MIENEFKKGIEKIKNFKLKNEEKKRILEYILNAPIPSPYAPKRSFWAVSVSWNRVARVGAVLFLFVSASGVVAFKAESSLPGDKLYYLKVGVSEPVRGLINITPESKAEWESTKAVKRLEEAADLAVEGKLNEKNRTDLESRFNKHTDAFNISVLDVASSSKNNLIETEFKENISAHIRVLESLEAEKDQGDNADKNENNENNENGNKKEELKRFRDTVSNKMKERETSKESRGKKAERD